MWNICFKVCIFTFDDKKSAERSLRHVFQLFFWPLPDHVQQRIRHALPILCRTPHNPEALPFLTGQRLWVLLVNIQRQLLVGRLCVGQQGRTHPAPKKGRINK